MARPAYAPFGKHQRQPPFFDRAVDTYRPPRARANRPSVLLPLDALPADSISFLIELQAEVKREVLERVEIRLFDSIGHDPPSTEILSRRRQVGTQFHKTLLGGGSGWARVIRRS